MGAACAKIVGGHDEADLLMALWQKFNWLYMLVDDQEPVRFGAGERVWSKQASIVFVVLGGVGVIIKLSSVEPDVPLVVSKLLF